MAHYAPEFLAAVRHRYEKTDQPMIEMAREFGIGITTLQVMVDKQGWEKRSQRLRGLPGAMRLQREAEALAADLPSAEKNPLLTPAPSPPLAEPVIGPAREGRTGWLAGEGEITVAGSGAQTPIERLERLVTLEIADLESARELRGGKRVSGAGAERTAQALASLTRTLQTIRAMRGERTPAMFDQADDADLDAQREALAYRIDALVAEWRAEEEREKAAAEAAGATVAPGNGT